MQHTQFFHVWSFFLTRSVHSIYKPLKNELNFVYQLSKFFKECTRFIHSTYTIVKKKKVHNFVYSKYTKFQRIYIILFIQWTQIFKEYTQLCTFNVYFQRMYIICMFIVHFFFFFFNRMCTILYIQCTQFLKEYMQFYIFNVHNCIYSMYTKFSKNILFFFFHSTSRLKSFMNQANISALAIWAFCLQVHTKVQLKWTTYIYKQPASTATLLINL